MKRPTLPEPITVSEWRRNRRGRSTDRKADVRQPPCLAAAVANVVAKAIELGLAATGGVAQ